MNLRSGKWLGSKIGYSLVLGLLVSWLGAQVNESTPLVGYPEDWTHHRIKFTLQGLREHPEIASLEPRAVHQLYRQWRAYQAPLASTGIDIGARGGLANSAAPANHADWSVPLGGGTIAFGQFPAKWTMDPSTAPSCTTDYIVFALNVAGAAGGQANLVAFSNLYSGAAGTPLCSGGGPTVRFAYSTSTQANGVNRTSPVLSLDGTKIAFVESHAAQAGNPAKSYLHILTIGTTGGNGSSVTAAVTPGVGNNAVNVSILYATATDTRSSPWVDYKTDTLYVSSDDGRLYKFTGVFKGTPTLANGSGWPISINVNTVMTGPVFDDTTRAGVMYIGDSTGRVYGIENIRAVAPAVPGPVNPRPLAAGANGGIFDSPLFDVTGSRVFAFTANGIADNGVQGATIALLDEATNGQSLNVSRSINIGGGSNQGGGGGVTIYDGDFDNAYYNTATGHMVVCGTGGAAAGVANNVFPYQYSVPIAGGVPNQFGVTSVALTNNSLTSRCGPVTEYFNPNIGATGTDFLMYGVTSNCRITGSLNSGCVVSFQNGTTTVKAVEAGGTSGIVIDNDTFTGDPGGQTSSLYFATQGGTRSAVKLTQLGLK